MFYSGSNGRYVTRALAVLTPSESKRLIAKAVCRLPEVRGAFDNGRIVIIGGTTNAYVVEELLGIAVDKFRFASGRIAFGELGANDPSTRRPPVVIINGEVVDGLRPVDVLKEFTANDVYIKGANAVDAEGHAGVLMADGAGGTIGASMGIIQARGSNLIVPVGLEKLVPSVIDAAGRCGQDGFAYSMGLSVGLMPLVDAKVITEVQAIEVLFGREGVRAHHVASGGVAGCEGAVVLAIEGEDGEGVKKAFEFLQSVKGEVAVGPGEE